MLHPAFHGTTIDGTNTKENVALYLTKGRLLLADDGTLYGSHALYQPIPEASTQPRITPIMGILHSNAAPAYTRWERLVAYWRRADITGEAHFQVDLSGLGIQALPVTRRADCNFKANSFIKNGTLCGAISYETADYGAATLANTEWNLEQLEFIISSMFLFCIAYRIYCTPCGGPYESGLGYHTQYPEWSSYTGKTCPGSARIKQMPYIFHELTLRIAEYYKQCGGSCP
jgi:hypothetical protein